MKQPLPSCQSCQRRGWRSISSPRRPRLGCADRRLAASRGVPKSSDAWLRDAWSRSQPTLMEAIAARSARGTPSPPTGSTGEGWGEGEQRAQAGRVPLCGAAALEPLTPAPLPQGERGTDRGAKRAKNTVRVSRRAGWSYGTTPTATAETNRGGRNVSAIATAPRLTAKVTNDPRFPVRHSGESRNPAFIADVPGSRLSPG
jgi:hypothetical protein